MELIAKYYDRKNNVLLFNDNQILCTIEDGDVDTFEKLIDIVEKSEPEEIIE